MARDHGFDDNENEDKWFLTFKVYGIISLQFLLAVAVGSVVVSVSRIPHFVLHTAPGLSIYIISIVLCLITPCLLVCLQAYWPCNYILLILWTILFASAVGLSCSYSKGRGKTVFETIILVSVVAVVLALHSLYSMLRERDFRDCELILISIFLVACVYIPIQVFHPFANLSTSIFGCLAALAVAGSVILAVIFCIKEEFYDPLAAAVIAHLIFLIIFLARKEVVGTPLENGVLPQL